MTEITLQLPDETPLAMRLLPEQVGDALRMAAAVKLYELQNSHLAPLRALAGVPRVVFLAKLADYGVDTFDLSEDQLAKETRLA